MHLTGPVVVHLFLEEQNMTVVEQEVSKMLQNAEKTRMWGSIEIDVQDGRPTVLRQTTTKKLCEQEPRRDNIRTLFAK